MTRPLPGLRLAASLLVAGGIYAVLPSAHALTGAENLAPPRRCIPPPA